MAKFIARLVVGLAVLYALGATAYAYVHYEGAKPDVPTILADFNGWLGSLVATKKNAAAPTPPAPTDAPAPDAPSGPTPAPAPPPPAGAEAHAPPSGLDAQGKELWRIQTDVLPHAAEKARALRAMSRADAPAFESARTDVMAMLGDARTFLNGILEKEPDHAQANRLWGRLQEIYNAVKKL